jgi:hypothetical protein
MEAFVLHKYDKWLADHMEELVRRYPSKDVAVHEGQVVYTGDAEVKIYRWANKTGLIPMPLVFRIPRATDLDSIL